MRSFAAAAAPGLHGGSFAHASESEIMCTQGRRTKAAAAAAIWKAFEGSLTDEEDRLN